MERHAEYPKGVGQRTRPGETTDDEGDGSDARARKTLTNAASTVTASRSGTATAGDARPRLHARSVDRARRERGAAAARPRSRGSLGASQPVDRTARETNPPCEKHAMAVDGRSRAGDGRSSPGRFARSGYTPCASWRCWRWTWCRLTCVERAKERARPSPCPSFSFRCERSEDEIGA